MNFTTDVVHAQSFHKPDEMTPLFVPSMCTRPPYDS